VSDQAPPLELTLRNLLTGGAFVLLIFPAALGLTLLVATVIADWGNETALPYSIVVGLVGMVGAALVSLVAIPLLVIPTAAGVSWLLRRSATVWHHVVGQFLAGVVVASVIVVVASKIQYFGLAEAGEVLLIIAIVAVTGATSALGWWLTLRRSRQAQRERPFGEANEDWE